MLSIELTVMNLRTKFKVPSFIHSKDGTGAPQFDKNLSCHKGTMQCAVS